MKIQSDIWQGLFRRWFRRWHQSIMVVRAEKIKLREMEANAIRHIAPDANARLGVAFDGETFRNLDDRAVFTMLKNIAVDPIMQQLDRMERLLIAAGPGGAQKVTEMLPTQNVAQPLPEHIPLRSLVETSTWRDLVLGVSSDGPIRADLTDLVHIAIGGSSGWGKSIFLRAIAFQLATSVDPVDLVMVDLEKATLAPFEQCDRLLYPVIDNERDTVAVFEELTDELDRRKELFNRYPGVDSLRLYNSQADEQINPLVLIGDEITALLSDKNVESRLRTLALRSRKYGMWLILAGQDWRAASLDITIRNQLSSCIQFKAKSGAQSRVLLDKSDAQDLTIPGRALAWLPGREMIEMQSPIIGHQDIIAAMTGSGPQYSVPEPVADDLEDRVLESWQSMAHPSITAVCREIFDGQQGGANWERIKRIVYSTGLAK